MQRDGQRAHERRGGDGRGRFGFQRDQHDPLVPIPCRPGGFGQHHHRAPGEDVCAGQGAVVGLRHREDVDAVAFAEQFAHTGIGEPDGHHAGVGESGGGCGETGTEKPGIDEGLTGGHGAGEGVANGVVDVVQGPGDQSGPIALHVNDVVGREGVPGREIASRDDDTHTIGVGVAAQREDHREGGEESGRDPAGPDDARPAGAEEFDESVGERGLQRGTRRRARAVRTRALTLEERERADGHAPNLEGGDALSAPMSSRKRRSVDDSTACGQRSPEGQLAAAAGAEDVLLDDDELLSLDEELLELVDADSLAVLPLRESVR